MENVWTKIGAVAAVVGAAVGGLFGGWDGYLYTLLIFVTLDYITGVMAAGKAHAISSEVGFWGIAKKVLIFALVIAGNAIDASVVGSGATFRTAVIFFYLANEGVSILENYAKIGLPFPEKLRIILEQLRDKEAPK